MAEGYLPPDPGGPEPELGAGGGRPPQPEQAQRTWGGPQQQQQGWAPPQQEWGTPQHTWSGPPQQPTWPQQHPGWGQPHPAWSEPDNTPAVTGFALSIASIGLLVMSGSLSSVLSLGLGIGGIVQARGGKKRIARGETRKHGDLATAGVVVGWISTVLSALASLFWVGIVVAVAVDAGTRHDFQDGLDGDGDPAVWHLAAAVRLIGVALS